MAGLLQVLNARRTRFVAFDLPNVGGTGRALTFDGNSKVTCDEGSFEHPAANCLSLPNVASCPGATPACLSSCYVHGLNEEQPALAAAYARNMSVIQQCLMTEVRFHNSAEHVAAYASKFERFRWHVSGDVFSPRYARWIVRVCELAPATKFWIYTRSLSLVPVLLLAENLAVNVSADSDNFEEAVRTRDFGFGNRLARICYMLREGEQVPQLPKDSVIFPDYEMREARRPDLLEEVGTDRRRMICPADYYGQSHRYRCGPCKKCLRPARS